MLKQLGQEVQEAKVKMNRIEKAVKGLQREVEEGEHSKDVNERYSQELMNMVMQKYQAAEVGTFNPNLPLPM